MDILDLDLTREVDAVVAASEYLAVNGSEEASLVDLKNRALGVLGQRVASAAIDSLAGPYGRVPVVDIVVVAIAQTWGWVSEFPEGAAEFFRAVGPDETPEQTSADRRAAAERMNEVAQSILHSMALVADQIKEQGRASSDY